MTLKHRIIITGGGTGGHVYPALAVAEVLQSDASVEDILYIGAAGHLEEKLAKQQGLEFVGLKSSGMPRKFSPEIFGWALELIQAASKARSLLASFRPTAILATGGYASAPVLVASCLQNIPFIVHEPDAHAGLVNRVFAKRAKLVSLGMGGAQEQLGVETGRCRINGNPVSKRFLSMPSRVAAANHFGLNPAIKTVLITGGSQGAQAINQAVFQALPRLLSANEPVQILHQIGDKNWDTAPSEMESSVWNHPCYKPHKYFDQLEIAYAACNLTICRAGAMTISELFITGTPTIFVPYPYAAQGHQMFNARYVESKGGAIVIDQKDLSPNSLYDAITQMLGDSNKLNEMKQNMLKLAKPAAATDLATQLKEISNKKLLN